MSDGHATLHQRSLPTRTQTHTRTRIHPSRPPHKVSRSASRPADTVPRRLRSRRRPWRGRCEPSRRPGSTPQAEQRDCPDGETNQVSLISSSCMIPGKPFPSYFHNKMLMFVNRCASSTFCIQVRRPLPLKLRFHRRFWGFLSSLLQSR